MSGATRLLGRLLPPLCARWPSLLLIAATTAVMVSAELGQPYVIQRTIDEMTHPNLAGDVWIAGLAIVVLALLQGVADWARLYFMARAGQDIILDLRVRLFEHLVRLPFSFFDRARTGDLVARVVSDVESLSLFYTRAAILILGNGVVLVGVFALMFAWDQQLALVFLALLPLLCHAMSAFSRHIRPRMRAARARAGSMTARLHETLVAMPTVKGLGREAAEYHRLEELGSDLRDLRIGVGRVTGLWHGYPVALLGTGSAIVLWLGGGAVVEGRLTLGTLVGFLALYGLLLRPLRQTGFMLSLVLKAYASADRVYELLDIPSTVVEAEKPVHLDAVEGRVSLEHVSFQYGDDAAKVLDDIDIDIGAGDLVALVGPSGAGKTTLAHLIPRFYDPREGRVLIDGQDVSEVALSSLRRRVGIAFQHSFLFDATMGQNIAWGRPEATEAEVLAAADTALLGPLVRSLPAGLETQVGERGLRLSGGQRQRVALARVLLYSPRVLILDEPTASLDPAAEHALQEVLERVRTARTTIVIAHRLWSVRAASRILVLDEGRVVQQAASSGTASAHELLSRQQGLYASLLERQEGSR